MMKPCPFCRNTNQRLLSWSVDKHMEHAVECLNCGARGPNELTVHRAWDMWNMRRQAGAHDVREFYKE